VSDHEPDGRPDDDPADDAEPGPWRRYGLPALLYVLTFATTTWAGAFYAEGGGTPSFVAGFAYSIPLMAILTCHELGHFVVAKLHRVPASLPHFVPLPPWLGLGTLGAVIGMRRVTVDRRKLIDIGAAGPLAGLAVAIPVLAYGLSISSVGPLPPDGYREGNSIGYMLLKRAVTGRWLPSDTLDVNLHPTAWAGWAGLLLTMINLLPLGQLDGGHIATAYAGNGWNARAQRLHRLLPFAGLAAFLGVWYVAAGEIAGRLPFQVAVEVAVGASIPYLMWYGLVRLMRWLSGGINHTPVEDVPLPRSRRVLFWLVVAIFLLIVMPVPLRRAFGPGDLSQAAAGASP